MLEGMLVVVPLFRGLVMRLMAVEVVYSVVKEAKFGCSTFK
jgi:hypothetical protein